MPSISRVLAISALLALVNCQAILLNAKGTSGESLALQLLANDTKDAQIINDAEIDTNIVNECGRTLLNGNIDIGQNTEDAIAAKKVTTVTKGSKVVATFKQLNAQGAGPFTCDMDQTSNSIGLTGQTPLKVQEAKEGDNIKLTITMPADMKLIGASTGDIGTVRCRNKQNFGGCFAVQQTDVTPNKNTPENVATAQTLENILNQVAQDIKDLPVVIPASAAAKTESEQGTNVIDALLKNNPQVKQANGTATGGAAGAGKGNNKGNGKGNAKGNGKGNAKGNNRGQGKAKNGNANAGKATGNNGKATGNNGKATNANKKNRQANRRAVAERALRWAKRVLEEEDEEGEPIV